MKLIYVAGKYSGKTKEEVAHNIRVAGKASLQLNLKGWCVYTPHKNNAFYEQYEFLSSELNWDFWMDRCYEMISRCDAIFFLTNWKDSPGALNENDFAKRKKMPIYYHKDGIPEIKN